MIELMALKDFYVDLEDGDGFVLEQNGMHIEKGSVWVIDNDEDLDVYATGGEVEVYNLNTNGYRYLSDISKNDIGVLFKELDS